MRTRTTLAAAMMLAAGALLGWLTASGRLVPAEATKLTHPRERDVAKVLLIARNYGAGAQTLAAVLA